jgi:hypothetical protein
VYRFAAVTLVAVVDPRRRAGVVGGEKSAIQSLRPYGLHSSLRQSGSTFGAAIYGTAEQAAENPSYGKGTEDPGLKPITFATICRRAEALR